MLSQTITGYTIDFNPLPPDGGRHVFVIHTVLQLVFQSTPSGRRETKVSR